MYQSEPTADLLNEEFIPVYGTFGQRFLAILIDGVILIIPELLLQRSLPLVGYYPLVIILQWLYFAIMESGSNQATFGKKAMGLKVTNLNGEKINFAQASGRYFGKIISSLILFIGYLRMLWDDKKQTLHDKMAGTLVVKR
jgi:uncharacterized RDD family membrane protein YckC